MSGFELIKGINDVIGAGASGGKEGRVNYVPYNINDTLVTIGLPPVALVGIEYVWARHDNPQTAAVKCLTGKSIFVSNTSQAGTIEIALLGSGVSSAAIEAMELTGIPFPINIIDRKTIDSRVTGDACRLVGTPQWRRALNPDLDIFTFAVSRLFLSRGLRLQE